MTSPGLADSTALAGVIDSLADGKLTLRTNATGRPFPRPEPPADGNMAAPAPPNQVEVPLDRVTRVAFASRPNRPGNYREASMPFLRAAARSRSNWKAGPRTA